MCVALLFALWTLPGQAQEDDLLAEPPQIRALLDEAMSLEFTMGSPDEIQHAAALYSKASRLGSLEAQYRLGLLYASGKGVPKNHDYASVMFSLAAQQGFAQAQNMLEIMHLHTSKLPPCMVYPQVLPEHPAEPDKLCLSK